MAVRPSSAAASALLAAATLFTLTLPPIAADATQSHSNQSQFDWQLLSAKNFSSQISLHPHVLLFVTVPWCGESRSLMREISLKLAKEQQKYSSVKLMFIYRNVDKVLADSLGAVEEITVLCYHHAMSYKYQGNLRVPDILSSVHYLVSLAREELPLRKISNSEDLETFLASTDKSVLLLETCGWTSKLLAQLTTNEPGQGGLLLRDLNKDSNITHASGWKKYPEDVGSELTGCGVEDECGRSPWIGEFSAENGTSSKEDMPINFGASCSFSEYMKFESFFSKFIAAAREAYLPPQSQKYAVLSDRLMLSPLGVEIADLWSLIISYAGCPGCITKVEEETYLQKALEMNDLPVMELLEDEMGLGPSLPLDTPSILLFVDRQSESMETAKKSRETLLVFKEFALQHQKVCQMDGRSGERPKKSPRSDEGSAGTHRNSRLVLSSPSDKIKKKMSVVIIKDGKYITLDNKDAGSSVHEVLGQLLRQKDSKLSTLAKEAGFQLLSDDIDMKITDVLSSQMGTQNLFSTGNLEKVAEANIIDRVEGYAESVSPVKEEMEQPQPINVEAPIDGDEQTSPLDPARKQSGLVNRHQSFSDPEVGSSLRLDHKFLEGDSSESLDHHYNCFTGSFFFCDGNDKFRRSLTSDLEVPSIVIIDPISQQHYVFSGETKFNLSSISTFIEQFRNGSLIPYQRSGPLRKATEMIHPPFVNLDFQEKDPIPFLTTETFSELVIGTGQSDDHNNLTNAWHKDVLVLFSSSWCGFCQRMELVVREVYRAVKGYINLVACDSENEKLCSKGNFEDVIWKLPAIYSIDCTSNDCGWILKSSGQREVYPTLLLFPAEKKTVIPFNGNMIVTDIINFLANHGVGSEHPVTQKGALWSEGGKNDNHDMSRDAFVRGFSHDNSEHVEEIIEDKSSQNQVTLEHGEKETSWNLVVGSFLVASERLNGLSLFSEARILIVNADPDVGFQGLIVNKPISWNHVVGFKDADLLKQAPVSFGGPVIRKESPLVSLTKSSLSHQYPQVMPGVYFLDPMATINNIKEIKAGIQSSTEYWFFFGYSSWDRDQLFNEINEGSWRQESTKDLQWP